MSMRPPTSHPNLGRKTLKLHVQSTQHNASYVEYDSFTVVYSKDTEYKVLDLIRQTDQARPDVLAVETNANL